MAANKIPAQIDLNIDRPNKARTFKKELSDAQCQIVFDMIGKFIPQARRYIHGAVADCGKSHFGLANEIVPKNTPLREIDRRIDFGAATQQFFPSAEFQDRLTPRAANATLSASRHSTLGNRWLTRPRPRLSSARCRNP